MKNKERRRARQLDLRQRDTYSVSDEYCALSIGVIHKLDHSLVHVHTIADQTEVNAFVSIICCTCTRLPLKSDIARIKKESDTATLLLRARRRVTQRQRSVDLFCVWPGDQLGLCAHTQTYISA